MRLPTAGLLVIKERKLLLAYSFNKHCFYLPGGKVDSGETAAAALCREVREELNVELADKNLNFYTHISAPAFGENEGVWMEQDCFFANTQINPVAGAEIGELKFFSLKEYLQETSQAPGVIMILQKLQNDQLID